MADVKSKNNRADYRSRTYNAQEADWALIEDIQEGTPRLREKRGLYLPKFDGEDPIDYEARIKMTFVNNHYAQSLEDHVGLAMANPPELGGDVPEVLEALLENVDGEGNHYQVFMQDALLHALDVGHIAILTDYPSVVPGTSLAEAREQQLRPYLVLYTGKQIVSGRRMKVGGVEMVQQIVFEEEFLDEDGDYGERPIKQYRTFTHIVERNAAGVVTKLLDVVWKLERVGESGKDLELVDEGTLRTPSDGPLPRIPVRIAYGGRKKGFLHSKPHLLELAYTNVQETQVESDYAAVMHKCNVPTPVFIGRGKKRPGAAISMGSGIDLPMGGSAMFLEPSGAALTATRNRLTDIRAQIQRQGGFVRETSQQMTATEVALYARQRNARLVRALRSLLDAMEGAFMDMALYLPETAGKSGSIEMSMEFGVALDPQFVQLCLDAFDKGALPLEAMMYVLKTGKLPPEFDPEDEALRMLVSRTPAEPMDTEGDDDAAVDDDEDEENDDEPAPPKKKTRARRTPLPPADDDEDDDSEGPVGGETA